MLPQGDVSGVEQEAWAGQMTKKLYCEKCERFLGELAKGAIRKGSVLLCSACWARAEIAIQMADLALSHKGDFAKSTGDKAVDELMGFFGMKK